MKDLPSIVGRYDLKWAWEYQDRSGETIAIVARYDGALGKKYYRQYFKEGDTWREGRSSPTPLYGLDLLPQLHSGPQLFIVEGEKVAAALQSLGFVAVTSMGGACSAHTADWTLLRDIPPEVDIVFLPDNDSAGLQYIQTIASILRDMGLQNPLWQVSIGVTSPGADVVDWLKAQDSCPDAWDGFRPIDDEPHRDYLAASFRSLVEEGKQGVSAEEVLVDAKPAVSGRPVFGRSPQLLQPNLLPVAAYPIKTWPQPFRLLLEYIEKEMQIPVDYVAAPLLVILGRLIGRKRRIQVKPNSQWTETPNLWGIVIGRPGSMKSPAMGAIMGPLNRLEDRARELHQKQMAEHKELTEDADLIKQCRTEVRKNAVKKAIKAETAIPPPLPKPAQESIPAPMRRRYKTSDATVEKFGELLRENPQGMLLFRDELAGWLLSLDRLGHEGDRQFYLEAWDGKQSFDVDRIVRGSIHIPALCISVLGGITPGRIAGYVKQCLSSGAGDDGLLQRLQVLVWPDGSPDWSNEAQVTDQQLLDEVERAFSWLNELIMGPDGEPVTLSFDLPAQRIFDEWQGTLERRLRGGELPPYMEAHLAKYKKLVPVISLILQLASVLSQAAHMTEVGEAAVRAAIELAGYFESHAWRLYGRSKTLIWERAKKLLDHVRRGDIAEPFSTREVYHSHHWGGLSTAAEVQEVLDLLEELGWLQRINIPGTGRPLWKYWVHPDVNGLDPPKR